jgi:DNA-binding CsgD family transcriptional regulator
VAAAEPVGDPALLWRAAERLGIRIDTCAPLETAGLLEVDSQVRFRHPLVRSAVCRASSGEERRGVHRALAEATDPDADPDRRAWHAAQAAAGPDEDVAADLERSAGRAQDRGGLAAAAVFLERAAVLTPEPARRVERTLAAAHAVHQSGAPTAALRLLTVAEAGPLDKVQRARVDLLRSQIALMTTRGREAPPMLLRAARQLEPLDPALSRRTYLDALLAAMFAGSFGAPGGVREVAEAARSAPPAPQPPSAADLLLDGLAVRFTDGYAVGLPPLRRALAAFREPGLTTEELGWLWLARITAGHMWDEETLDTASHVRLARESGALMTLPLALAVRIGAHVLVGELADAATLVDELESVSAVTENPIPPYGALLLAAWRGQEAEATALFEATTAEAVRRGEGFGLTVAGCAQAVLLNSIGRYEEAFATAGRAAEQPPAMGVEPWGVLAETVEAAVRTGRTEQAADALARLTGVTGVSGSDWALGIQARCRAQLSDGAPAEDAHREAVDRLGRTRIRGELARAHLLYGEWLRRERRRFDAREQLRTAHELFGSMGMAAFARRAAQELVATGETVRRRTVETGTELTAQEAQIVRLVREGLSNPEIAERLFISLRTVEWHMGKIFRKLHITSRRQLRQSRATTATWAE